MRPSKRMVSREELRDLYVTQGLSFKAISERCGVEPRTVGKWLRADGIPARPPGAVSGQGIGQRKRLISKEDLERMYIAEGLTQTQIAERIGISEWGVGKRLRALGIQARPTNWHREEPRKQQFAKEDLMRLYVTERRTMKQIGDEYGLNPLTIAKWLRRYGIPTEAPWERRAVEIDIDELKRLYFDEKYSFKRLAAHFHCSPWTIRWNFWRCGIDTRNAGDRTHFAKRSRTDRGIHRGYPQIMRTASDGSQETVLAHRAAAEEAIGRPLEPKEVVHHIDTDKANYAITNLAVLPDSRSHQAVHKYMERVAVYLVNLTDRRPEPLTFAAPVFWGGEYVTSVDLLRGASAPQNSNATVRLEIAPRVTIQ